jgi:hypothetical protein
MEDEKESWGHQYFPGVRGLVPLSVECFFTFSWVSSRPGRATDTKGEGRNARNMESESTRRT